MSLMTWRRWQRLQQPLALLLLLWAQSAAAASTNDSGEEAFLARREAVYAIRRERVRTQCRRLGLLKEGGGSRPEVLRQSKGFGSFIFHERRHRLTYCLIPKVASSTWSHHLRDLSAMTTDGRLSGPRRHRRPIKRPQKAMRARVRTNVTEDDYDEAFGSGAVSLAIVRHPLKRLVSAYGDKIATGRVLYSPHKLQDMRSFFRDHGLRFAHRGRRYQTRKARTKPIAPRDYLAYALARPDRHWDPQHTFCPFCSRNFTVYSKLEDMAKDTEYVFQRLGRVSLNASMVLNRHRADPDDAEEGRNFWSDVPPRMVARVLYKYRADLALFGYSAGSYFGEIGLPELYRKAMRMLSSRRRHRDEGSLYYSNMRSFSSADKNAKI